MTEILISSLGVMCLLILIVIVCKKNKDKKKDYTDPWLLMLSDKIRELEIRNTDLEKHVQKIQDTFDHYGMRMSNKIPAENKYYKRWFK